MILRPLTPPRASTYLKYASAPIAVPDPEEASPVRGVVPPIRISLALTPGSAAGLLPNAPGSATSATAIDALASAIHLLMQRPLSWTKPV